MFSVGATMTAIGAAANVGDQAFDFAIAISPVIVAAIFVAVSSKE